MAVHGTRRGESVSWDYEGLLQLLSSLARERSGLPLLRCYWYEATVDGHRTAEQDALADVPGIKLRIAKIRPGRREGVETEIHRDLTTLARNNAISDALVVSAEEDLAQVIADVQDLGMRVMLVHIAVDGNWTISRALRQESDDIIEIGGDHLRPYVELIAGAEPVHPDTDDDLAAARPLANGHSTTPAASYQQVPPASGNHAPPAIYTAPVVAEYQRPALQLPRAATREAREPRDGRDTREDRPRDERHTATSGTVTSGPYRVAARRGATADRPPGHRDAPGATPPARTSPRARKSPPARRSPPGKTSRPGLTSMPGRSRTRGPARTGRNRHRRTQPPAPAPRKKPPITLPVRGPAPGRDRDRRARRRLGRCRPGSPGPRACQAPPGPKRPRLPRDSCGACRPRVTR